MADGYYYENEKDIYEVFINIGGICLANGDNGKHRMYADFSEESYDALKNGDATFNNGFRANKGYFMPDQPDFKEIDDENDESQNTDSQNIKGEVVAAVIITAIVTFAVTKATPHVKNWWLNKAFPGIKRTWNKIRKKDTPMPAIAKAKEEKVNTTELVVDQSVTPSEFSHEIDVAFEQYKENMSSSEAQEHILAIMVAAPFIADEIRKLSNATIKDDSEFIELKGAIEKLTTQQVTDSINLMLENNVSLLDEKTSANLFKYFGCGKIAEGEYIPITNDKVKEALRFNF